MWKKISKEKPKSDGALMCYGTVNVGSEYEKPNCRFTAYWNENLNSFTDKDGEDLIGINRSVEYWFDFSEVRDPNF